MFQLQQQLSSSTSILFPTATQPLPVASPQPQLNTSLLASASAAANHPSLCQHPSAFSPLQPQYGPSLVGGMRDTSFEGSDDAQVCVPAQMMALYFTIVLQELLDAIAQSSGAAAAAATVDAIAASAAASAALSALQRAPSSMNEHQSRQPQQRLEMTSIVDVEEPQAHIGRVPPPALCGDSSSNADDKLAVSSLVKRVTQVMIAVAALVGHRLCAHA